jgi:hypothetical protein
MQAHYICTVPADPRRTQETLSSCDDYTWALAADTHSSAAGCAVAESASRGAVKSSRWRVASPRSTGMAEAVVANRELPWQMSRQC